MTTLHYILSMMGISMLINVEKKAKGGGGAPAPPGNSIWTYPWLGF